MEEQMRRGADLITGGGYFCGLHRGAQARKLVGFALVHMLACREALSPPPNAVLRLPANSAVISFYVMMEPFSSPSGTPTKPQ